MLGVYALRIAPVKAVAAQAPYQEALRTPGIWPL